eukprot:TRINITY_DN6227_c0_g1_i17.p1 TRINITY_DN6227_c0_g1~~TRINITY_DN6227_c0_g1_i17.p1  ORF type:complete len:240 (-),score=53.74 TRINITY_DN6227_c0_g1_i17:164-883(-)
MCIRDSSNTAQARYLQVLQQAPKLNTQWISKLTVNSSRGVYEEKGKERFSDMLKEEIKAMGLEKSAEDKPKFDVKKFIARQRLHEINKKQKLEYLTETIEKDLPPKPEERSLSNQNKDSWFHPKTTPLPKDHRKVCTSARKTRKDQETNLVFTPKLTKSKKYSKVESKLQLKNNISTLMKRIKENVEAKERCHDHERYVKTLKEELECTYKPRIIQTPKYLRRHHSSSPNRLNTISPIN